MILPFLVATALGGPVSPDPIDPLAGQVGKTFEVHGLLDACRLLESRWGVPVAFESSPGPPIPVTVRIDPPGRPDDPVATLSALIAQLPPDAGTYAVDALDGGGLRVHAVQYGGTPVPSFLDTPLPVDLSPTFVVWDGVPSQGFGEASIYTDPTHIDIAKLLARNLLLDGARATYWYSKGVVVPADAMSDLEGRVTPREILGRLEDPGDVGWTLRRDASSVSIAVYRLPNIAIAHAVEEWIASGELVSLEDGGGLEAWRRAQAARPKPVVRVPDEDPLPDGLPGR
ncbi:MAG: hypothetical protein R3F61_23525 [Myxococcota bacterium]